MAHARFQKGQLLARNGQFLWAKSVKFHYKWEVMSSNWTRLCHCSIGLEAVRQWFANTMVIDCLNWLKSFSHFDGFNRYNSGAPYILSENSDIKSNDIIFGERM